MWIKLTSLDRQYPRAALAQYKFSAASAGNRTHNAPLTIIIILTATSGSMPIIVAAPTQGAAQHKIHFILYLVRE